MIKNILGILTIAALLVSCGSSAGDKKAEAEAAPVAVDFAGLIDNPAEFLNKDITIEGSVVHVCVHSGKKMFIVGEDPDIRLFINSDGEVSVFPMELLGSTVSVTGHLALVAEGEKKGEGNHEEKTEEAEHTEGEQAEEAGEHKVEVEKAEVEEGEAEDCATEAAVAKQPVLANYVLHYKSHEVK